MTLHQVLLEVYYDADPAVLGLRRSFRTDPAPWSATVELRIGRETYTARVHDGALAGIERGAGDSPDAVVTGPPEALRSGDGLEISGDAEVARRFLARATP